MQEFGVSSRPPAGATSAPSRIFDVDALRGFALLGILVVNITYFASGYPIHGALDPAYASGEDKAVRWLITFAFEMKFYLIFSFLFGYSFTLQMDSAARQGAAFTPRILRRLAGLLTLGFVHAVLLFYGDILSCYAVLGLILFALRGIKPRTALIVAGTLVGVVAIALLLAGSVAASDPVAALAEGHRTTTAMRDSPASFITSNIHILPLMAATLVVQGLSSFAAFLVGFAAGKRQVLARIKEHERSLRRIQWVGFPIGLAGAFYLASDGGVVSDLAPVAVTMLTGPFLAAAYMATALRFFRTAPGSRVMAALAPAGRMALTNYLSQSLICAVLFTAYGFRLAGHVSPLGTLLLAAAIFGAQLWLSRRWLTGHIYGPVEWLLRAVTLARLPAMRAGSESGDSGDRTTRR
ncbi:DUF418 domain-containing protein [Actinoallomurus spadix]|uniref:DUF418 domain-containing protein n=1 Tax=Actinoallomurus spadix TaxID=79912 RepID=A0ABN0XM80_9ACTN|nr:DUF418 domain-containing protein [Actinoallomurus spadix]MCO5985184.1 DUF418 domain-containing protein [Actinoallomurus spadix]